MPPSLLVIAAILFYFRNETRVNRNVPKSKKTQNANKICFWAPWHWLSFLSLSLLLMPRQCPSSAESPSGSNLGRGEMLFSVLQPLALPFCSLLSNTLSKN